MSDHTNKTFYCISGLPRSGSTLLCNILNQNPRFHATQTSGLIHLILLVRNNWDNIEDLKIGSDELAKFRVMKSIIPAFYYDQEAPVIFDKSRGWPQYLETLEWILGHQAKVLVTVRDIRDILSSFEKIWRTESKNNLIPQEKRNMHKFSTVEDRCEVWLSPKEPVGRAYNAIKDALVRGYGDRMHFVFFEKLTSQPQRVMKEIYDFLDEPYFQHDFNHIKQTTFEDDRMRGFSDLHTIRPQIEPLPSDWEGILGSFAEKYAELNFWDQKIAQDI